MKYKDRRNSLQPTTKKAKIISTTHVQMLQWLQGKQQQQLFYCQVTEFQSDAGVKVSELFIFDLRAEDSGVYYCR